MRSEREAALSSRAGRLAKSSCLLLAANPPIRLLGWSRDGQSFLFEETSVNREVATYQYDIASHKAHVMAVSSARRPFSTPATCSRSGTALSPSARPARSFAPLIAQLAVANNEPFGDRYRIARIQHDPRPALAESNMTYSLESKHAAMTAFSPSAAGPMRRIVVYAVKDKDAFWWRLVPRAERR